MIDFLALQVIMGRVTIARIPDAYRDALAVRLSELRPASKSGQTSDN